MSWSAPHAALAAKILHDFHLGLGFIGFIGFIRVYRVYRVLGLGFTGLFTSSSRHGIVSSGFPKPAKHFVE